MLFWILIYKYIMLWVRIVDKMVIIILDFNYNIEFNFFSIRGIYVW